MSNNIKGVFLRRAYSSRALRLAAVIAMVCFLAFKVDFGSLSRHFHWRLGLAILWIQPLAAVGLIFYASRTMLLLNLPFKAWRYCVGALMLSQGLNLLLPARIAELFKATYLHAHAEVSMPDALSAVVLERMVDLIIFGLIAVTSVAWFATGRIGMVAGAFAAVGCLMVLCSPWIMRRAAPFIAGRGWLRSAEFIGKMADSMLNGLSSPRFLGAFVLGVLTWVTSICNVVLFLYLALPTPLEIQNSLAVFVATTLGGVVPVLPGGFGAYEAGAMLVLRPLGFGFEEALVIGLALHVAQYVIPLIGAAAIMAVERVGVSHLIRQLRE